MHISRALGIAKSYVVNRFLSRSLYWRLIYNVFPLALFLLIFCQSSRFHQPYIMTTRVDSTQPLMVGATALLLITWRIISRHQKIIKMWEKPLSPPPYICCCRLLFSKWHTAIHPLVFPSNRSTYWIYCQYSMFPSATNTSKLWECILRTHNFSSFSVNSKLLGTC